jgi:hypothetical protein
MRETSGRTAPSEPVTSRVATPSSTPASRTVPPRAMTAGRTLRSSALAILAVRSIAGQHPGPAPVPPPPGPRRGGGTVPADRAERGFQIGDQVAGGLDAD